jgi:hypothetical protein
VVIAADNDAPAYDKYGRRLPNGLDAAWQAKHEWEGVDPSIDVQIETPSKPKGSLQKRDWNDVLMESSHE